MKKFMCAVLIFASESAFAADWGLPITVSDNNTTISFEVDSTWHLVEGTTKGIAGSLALAAPADLSSVHGTVSLPVNRFDTESSRRDDRMREVMEVEKFAVVEYRISGADILCSDQEKLEKPCPVHVRGDLAIHGVVKPWELRGEIQQSGDTLTLRSVGHLRWAEFGIEDPSIIVARLHPDVKVNVVVTWPVSPIDKTKGQ